MSEFFKSFGQTIAKLLAEQRADPPAVVLEVFAKVLRFGLLAVCIAAGLLAVQCIIALCLKKQRKTAIPLGITCLVLAAVALWAFLPINAASKTAVDSAALQTVVYVRTSVLAEQAARDAAASAPVGDAAASVPAQDATTGDAGAATSSTGADTGASGATSDPMQEDAVPAVAKQDTLQRTIADQAELSAQQTQGFVKLLQSTKCMRTTRQTLPTKDAQNVLLRLAGGKRWQVLLLPDAGYVYAAEGTGFLCKIQDYEMFYQQAQELLKAA